MSVETRPNPFVCLIAPNVSEQMGGEAMMALQIYEELEARGVPVHQLTHSRVRDELRRRAPGMSVSYVEDDWLDRFLCRTRVLSMLMGPIFMAKAARRARRIVAGRPGAIVHYTSPVSPVTPMFRTPGARVVVGPINGNIHHPPAFRDRERASDRLRRLFLRPAQLVHRLFFAGKRTADVILVAGGERTRRSLRMAGCRDAQFRDSLTCGIPDRLRESPLIEHRGPNFRFVHNGRLMPHKGTDLAIKALTRTRNPVTLDIIGRGPERPKLERLAEDLGLKDRVRFIDWFRDHDAMYQALRAYRAFVFPSLAEAHGIVVQEAMMMGLPVVALDWGGPALLVTPETGILVAPSSEDDVLTGLAGAMDRLGEDGELADRMARAGRAAAIDQGYSWADVIDGWVSLYREPSGRPATAERAAAVGGEVG